MMLKNFQIFFVGNFIFNGYGYLWNAIADSLGTHLLDYIHPGDKQRTLEKFQPLNKIIAGIVTEFPESERVVLQLQGVLSILVLPLTVNGIFFGLIGFDKCTQARPWQASEIDLLEMVAAVVSRWNESCLAQQALRQSEAANRALLEAIPDALLRIRRDGTYIDFIPAKNNQTPSSATKFLGKKISEVLSPALSLKVSADVEAALSTGKVQVSEAPILFNGQFRPYEIWTVFYGDPSIQLLNSLPPPTKKQTRFGDASQIIKPMKPALVKPGLNQQLASQPTTCFSRVIVSI